MAELIFLKELYGKKYFNLIDKIFIHASECQLIQRSNETISLRIARFLNEASECMLSQERVKEWYVTKILGDQWAWKFTFETNEKFKIIIKKFSWR